MKNNTSSEADTFANCYRLLILQPYVFGSVYNASKAALHSYSDTLRVELAPFNVRVVTVVTGGVKSNIARTHRSLPRDSIYLPIAEDYEKRQTHSQANSIPNETYASTVVRQVLENPAKDTIWAGGRVWIVWFATTFLPRIVLVRSYLLVKTILKYLVDQSAGSRDGPHVQVVEAEGGQN